jgi:hypothetical protein
MASGVEVDRPHRIACTSRRDPVTTLHPLLALPLVLASCGRAPAPVPAAATVTLAPQETASAPEPPPGAAPRVEEVPRACVPLPASRPADLVFRFERHVVPHGGPIREEGIEVHGARTPCPATEGPRAAPVLPCRQVSEASLDAIFRAFKQRRFDAMRAGPPASSSPHYGGIYLAVVWGDHVCAVADDTSTSPPEGERGDFSALCGAVTGAQP